MSTSIHRHGIPSCFMAIVALLLTGNLAASAQVAKSTKQPITTKPSGTKSGRADPGPTLAESLEFVQQTLATEGKYWFTRRIALPRGDTFEGTSFKTSLSEIAGCKVSILSSSTTSGYMANLYPDTVSTYSLDLSMMDPNGISVLVPKSDDTTQYFGFTIRMNTRNNAAVISRETDSNIEKTSSVQLDIFSWELGNRISTALTHAITLCGGKPSAF
jgi:hypothetical protein